MLRGNGENSPDASPQLKTFRFSDTPEAASLRKTLREIEERSQRTQTGFHADPEHRVPYQNHPFEQPAAVTDDDDSNNRNLQETADLFQPMRIRFETKALDDMRDTTNAAKIDFIKNEILPRTAKFWSQALSVVPVAGNLRISTGELDNREYCGDYEFTRVPSDHISDGLEEADLVLYVSGTPSSRFCSFQTLAVAVACNFDQFDRPTAGAINVCLSTVELDTDGTASPAVIQDNVDVAIHEVSHILGHSSNSYRFFRDPDTGEALTPRPFSTREVTCVDSVTRNLILPADNTMKFFEATNGQRYASIVTPKVRAITRNQFDCQSLEGAQLENQPTGADSCTGDHWDERLFYDNALSGVISPTTNILTPMTLALFEDSGWYRANYTQASISPWGLGAGCDFATGPCIVNGDNGPEVPAYGEGYFCADNSQRGCSSGHTHKMGCTINDYYHIVPRDLPDAHFQYFDGSPTLGGPRQADFCPLFGSTYDGLEPEQLDCRESTNANTYNLYSEIWGEDSRCVESSTGEARCYQTACVKSSMEARINVRGEWLTCTYDFEKLDTRVGAGLLTQTIVCPRLSSVCPELYACPFNCAGRGACNYANIDNGTIVPKCECFDTTDTSPGCSDSLIPDGAYLEDGSGLFNNLEENFFDPLIAVFVDHPDLWTSASWAWAAGLMTVFLVLVLCICSSCIPMPKGSGKR